MKATDYNDAPFARGRNDGLLGMPGPSYPPPTAPWQARHYARGWSSGIDDRKALVDAGYATEIGEATPGAFKCHYWWTRSRPGESPVVSAKRWGSEVDAWEDAVKALKQEHRTPSDQRSITA